MATFIPPLTMPPKQTSSDLLGIHYSKNECLSTSEWELRSRTIALFEALNTRNWDHPVLNYIDPDVESFFDSTAADPGIQAAQGKEELLNTLKELIRSVLAYHGTYLDYGSKANERTGKAQVWILRSIGGLRNGLRWCTGVGEEGRRVVYDKASRGERHVLE
jgi:hypothetical protein